MPIDLGRTIAVYEGHKIKMSPTGDIHVQAPLGSWCVGRNEWLRKYLKDPPAPTAPRAAETIAAFKSIDDAKKAIAEKVRLAKEKADES